MTTYLLTWNPNRLDWAIEDDLRELNKRGFFDERWSCGRTRRIEKGDRLFLLRQGQEPRGIVASGYARSAPYEQAHWDEQRDDLALYVDVRFDTLLAPDRDGVLPLSKLKEAPLDKINWKTQSSGISIEPPEAAVLETVWRDFLQERGQSPIVTSEEILTPELYYEGASRTISVNAYERNSRARTACIEHHGTKCVVCAFDFLKVYGVLGMGFIHVHHLVPLAEIGESYVVDPIKDLCPVCPNCHAMLHRRGEVRTIEQLKIVMSNH